jgi:HAD superfamily phosphoserine phosphatase-like hydrolase
MPHLAIYDMDKTVTKRATFVPFLLHAAGWRVLFMPVVLAVAFGCWALAALGISRGDYRKQIKAFGFRLIVGTALGPRERERLAAGFVCVTNTTNVRHQALARIEADRASGCKLVLATASNRLYVDALAAAWGFDAAICTENDAGPDGGLSWRISGENCYAAAKLRMILTWLDAQGIKRDDAHIRFYSDHVSDAPCLDWADEAFAINPHPPLCALAARRGWTIFDWS